MAEAAINILNPKRENIRSQITKISKEVNENSFEIAEQVGSSKAYIKSAKKFVNINEEYYKIVNFDQTHKMMSQLDDEIRKIYR